MPLPLAVPIGAALLGGFLSHKGANKQQDQQNKLQEAEFLRQQQIDDQKARSRATMVAGLLKGYGKGGSVSEEQLYQMFRHNPAKPLQSATGGRNMMGIGKGLSGIAQMMMLGMKKNLPTTPGAGSVDFSGLAGLGDAAVGGGGSIAGIGQTAGAGIFP